ncbi:MAG: LytTR family DNA-binding domain-containing protein [Pseudomonadota bacterium]
MRIILVCVVLLGLIDKEASAKGVYDGLHAADGGVVRVCPARSIGAPDALSPPDFDDPECKITKLLDVEPNNGLLWVGKKLIMPATWDTEVALETVGVSSRAYYLNGTYLGATGRPAASLEGEVAGLVDATIFVPAEMLVPGENEVAILLSSQKRLIRRSNPLREIWFWEYNGQYTFLMRRYLPAAFTLGIFGLALAYFSFQAIMGFDRVRSIFFAVLAGMISLQLLVETMRGFVPYIYPIHDIRLTAIFGLTLSVGLMVLGYVVYNIRFSRPRFILAATAIIAIGFAMQFQDMDDRSGSAFRVILLTAASLSSFKAIAGDDRGWIYGWLLVATLAADWILPADLLDTGIFYMAAILLTVAAINSIYSNREQLHHKDDRDLSDRPAVTVADGLNDAASDMDALQDLRRMEIRRAGSTEFVELDDISHISGAGDYVEIVRTDKSKHLEHDSLRSLETRLPRSFQRVHRSHIANLVHVSALRRKPSGAGELLMMNGDLVAVSRKSMREIKTALEKTTCKRAVD